MGSCGAKPAAEGHRRSSSGNAGRRRSSPRSPWARTARDSPKGGPSQPATPASVSISPSDSSLELSPRSKGSQIYLPFNTPITGVQFVQDVPGRHWMIADVDCPPASAAEAGSALTVWTSPGCGCCDLLRKQLAVAGVQHRVRPAETAGWWDAVVAAGFTGGAIGLPVVTEAGRAWWSCTPRAVLKGICAVHPPTDDCVAVYGREGDGVSNRVLRALASKRVDCQFRNVDKDRSFLEPLLASGCPGGALNLPIVTRGSSRALWNFDRKSAHKLLTEGAPRREGVHVYGREACGLTRQTQQLLREWGVDHVVCAVDSDRGFVGPLSENGFSCSEPITLPIVVDHRTSGSGATAWWDFAREGDVPKGSALPPNWGWLKAQITQEPESYSCVLYGLAECGATAQVRRALCEREQEFEYRDADDGELWEILGRSASWTGGPVRLPVLVQRGRAHYGFPPESPPE